MTDKLYDKYVVLKLKNEVDLDRLISELGTIRTRSKNFGDKKLVRWSDLANVMISCDVKTDYRHCVYCGEELFPDRILKLVDNDYHHGYAHVECIMNESGVTTVKIYEMRGGKSD